ncbi:MAG: glycine cleavage system aminomethyltransferase GcvT [Actinomycetota bacterium]
MRHSPLHAEHVGLGARMNPFGGWEMPLQYPSGTIAEHHACRSDVVVFDVSHLGSVEVTGEGVFDRLQRTFTNDLRKIAPGRAQYTHLLDESGGVVDDIIVWWIDDDLFHVMPNASNTERVIAAIGGRDVTGDRALLAVQGPQARTKLSMVFPEAAEVGRFRIATAPWEGETCVIAGTGYTGEDGVEISVPSAVAASLWRELLAVGVAPAGLGARDTLRLEAGLPLHGHELGPGITPLQAGLEWVVSWDKGDFPGRAALAAENSGGLPRVLRGVATEGRRPPREGATVSLADQDGNGRVIEEVTSGNFSPTLGHGIALAFLDPAVALGTRVAVSVRDSHLDGTVVSPHFVTR